MSRAIVLRAAVAALAAALVAVPSAVAAPPDPPRPSVQKQTCEDAGGTFSQRGEVKSCATSRTAVDTAVDIHFGGPFFSADLGTDPPRLVALDYRYLRRVTTTEVITTTRSQRGNGPVTTTTTATTVSRTVSEECERRQANYVLIDAQFLEFGDFIDYAGSGPVPLQECRDAGVIPAA